MILWSPLPEHALFPVPVADPRSPLSSVTLHLGEADRVDAALGARFPLVRAEGEGWQVQLGLSAGGFMGFVPDDGLTFHLATFDGTFGLPVEAAVGSFAGTVQWTHTSAHFGDGLREAEIDPREHEAYSQEALSLLGGIALGPARPYAGVHVVLHGGDPDDIPLAIQAGAEVEAPWRIAPYAAADAQFRGDESWTPNLTGHLGGRAHVGPHRLRLALVGRTGRDAAGRLHDQEERYVGLQLGFDTAGVRLRVDDP